MSYALNGGGAVRGSGSVTDQTQGVWAISDRWVRWEERGRSGRRVPSAVWNLSDDLPDEVGYVDLLATGQREQFVVALVARARFALLRC